MTYSNGSLGCECTNATMTYEGLTNQCICTGGTTLNTETGNCECDAGTWDNNGNCDSCHESCLTCSGGNYDQCTSCKDRAYQDMDNSCGCYGINNSQINGECVCNEGYGWDPPAFSCVAITCDVMCSSCREFADACVGCFAETLLYTYVATYGDTETGTCECGYENMVFSTDYGQCVCQDGTFEDGGFTCLACDSSCATCSGGGNSNCTSCDSTRTLSNGICYCRDNLMLNLAGECNCDQPGYTLDGDDVTGTCAFLTCDDPNCFECIGQADFCTACSSGFVINASDTYGGYTVGTCECSDPQATYTNGQCTCPDGFAPFDDQNGCQQCDSTCATCTNIQYNYCASCVDGREYTPNDPNNPVSGECNCVSNSSAQSDGTCACNAGYTFDAATTSCIHNS